MRVLVSCLVEPLEDVLFEVLDRVPRRRQELREGLARAEGVLASEECNADAGDLRRMRQRVVWRETELGLRIRGAL